MSRSIRSFLSRSDRPPAAGFTLIELLVVISIIALLIGILLPALGAAKRSAQSAACLANVRGLTQAGLIYVTDFKGQFAPRPSSQSGIGGTGVWGAFYSSRTLLNYEKRDLKEFACPSDAAVDRLYPIGASDAVGDGSGTEEKKSLGLGATYGTGLTDTRGARISYGVNTQLTLVPTSTGASADNLVNSNKVDAYNSPSQTLVYADSTWVNARGFKQNDDIATQWALRYRSYYNNWQTRLVWSGGPLTTDSAVTQTVNGAAVALGTISPTATLGAPPLTIDNKGVDSTQFSRHGSSVNIAFLDGSSRSVPIADAVDVTPGTVSGSGASTVIVTRPQAKVVYSIAEDAR